MKKLAIIATLVLGGSICGGALAAPKATVSKAEVVTSVHILTAGKMMKKKKVAAKKAKKKVVAAKYKSCGTYAYWHKKNKKCWDARYNKAKA